MLRTTVLRTTHHRPAGSDRRPRRLVGAAAAATIAFALTACGSSQPDPVGLAEAAEAAAQTNFADAVKELDKVMATGEVPSQEEVRQKYDEWLAAKTADASALPKPDRPLAVGDCTDHLPTGAEETVADIASVDCAGEHLVEAYFSAPLDQLGGNYPRYTELLDEGRKGCGDAFVEYAGGTVIDTGVAFDMVMPSHDDWVAGDTDALCIAYPVSLAPFTGTLKASAK